MERPFAYVCAPMGVSDKHVKTLGNYAKQLHNAGMVPIVPSLMFKGVISSNSPQDRKRWQRISQQLVRRCRLVVICGNRITRDMACDLETAAKNNIITCTLDGILNAKTLFEKEKIDGTAD